MSISRAIPSLRPDLKVSRQVMTEHVHYVVKDPLKGEYYRFSEAEWRIISLFNGKRTLAEAVAQYNQSYPHDPIDEAVVKDYESSLAGMNLLEKSKAEMNVMLIEKMKEARRSMLLSKEGSLLYKRFPLVDPDRFFDRIISKLSFFWTKRFFILSVASILLWLVLVGLRFDEFRNGVFEVFAFSELSWWNLAFLWVTIYAVIAIHELGHGLTCKHYGGEVHEIGFLLLFFQPCLYANVNDAWLFDRKWKQVMVTIAGGYIEFFVGSLFGIVWALTNPNTLINVLSLQVMTICSLSTVIFNFNPLVKLDGYYLLADALEIPNLRESSFNYLKYFAKTRLFRMKVEDFGATAREERIFLIYGAASAFWVTSTTVGLYLMAKNFLTDHLQALGVLISFWVAYKLFGGHVKSVLAFGMQLLVNHRAFLTARRGKLWVGSAVAALLAMLLIPIRYPVRGHCTLEALRSEVIRASSNGVIRAFHASDGEVVEAGRVLFELQNDSLLTDAQIAEQSVRKAQLEARAVLEGDPSRLGGSREELRARQEKLAEAQRKVASLSPKTSLDAHSAVVHCQDQIRKTGSFVKEGDEICRVDDINELKTVVEVPENQVSYINIGDEAVFKLHSKPFATYSGRVARVRDMGVQDPNNPKARMYIAELIIQNPGELRPGMSGQAKVMTPSVSAARYAGRLMAAFFRLDLFY